jgi:hypothetical protein
MRKIFTVFGFLGILVFQACEGPPGPPGFPGEDGVDGVNIVAEVFEVELDFTAQNDYSEVFKFEPVIIESDVVLVFIEWEKDGTTPIWRALPQTVFFDQGVLIYNYDFTSKDFRLFLDGPMDYATLGTEWKMDQAFRVVVVPGDYASSRLDLTNYEAVTELLGLEEEDFKRIELKKKN